MYHRISRPVFVSIKPEDALFWGRYGDCWDSIATKLRGSSTSSIWLSEGCGERLRSYTRSRRGLWLLLNPSLVRHTAQASGLQSCGLGTTDTPMALLALHMPQLSHKEFGGAPPLRLGCSALIGCSQRPSFGDVRLT